MAMHCLNLLQSILAIHFGSYGLLGITLSLPFGIHTQSGRNLLTVFLLHRNQPIIPGRLGECHTKHHARSIGLRAWIFMVGYDMLYCRGNVICHRRFLRFLFFFGWSSIKTRRGQRNTDSMQAAIIPAKSIRRTHFTRLHLLLRMATPFLCDGIAICKKRV